jgi:hypothetical protein
MTLLAEDLLLLLLDDEKGTTPGLWVDVKVPLGAAVLAELGAAGAVEVEAPASRWRTPTVRPTGVPVDDDVLAAGLRIVAERPRRAVDLAGRIGDGLKDRLAERLAAAGLLERQDEKVLGLFPRTRWPAAAASHEAAVRERLRLVVVAGAVPDERSVALAGILQALDRLAPTLALKGGDARAAKARVKDLAQGDWATKAVRDAVEAATAAVTTATIVTTTVTATT